MKRLLILFICIVGMCVHACMGEGRFMSFAELPTSARQLVLQHFDSLPIAHINETTEVFTRNYTLRFFNGNSIEFNQEGLWTQIDCSHSSIPQSVLPLPLHIWLDKHEPSAEVVRIVKTKRTYDVTLDNGCTLIFDSQFRQQRVRK